MHGGDVQEAVDVVEALEQAHAHAAGERRADGVGLLQHGGRLDAGIVHVGHDLPPHRALRAAADDQDLVDGQVLAQDLQNDAQVHGHALEYAAQHVAALVFHLQADECALRVRIPARRALAQHVGQEDHAVGAHRALFDLPVDEIVGAHAQLLRLGGFKFADLVLQPGVAQTRGLHGAVGGIHAGHDVGPGHGAHLIVEHRLVAGGGDPRGGSHAGEGLARTHGARAHVGANTVAAAHHHRRTHGKSGCLGRFPGHAARHAGGGHDLGQLVRIDPGNVHDLLRPGEGVQIHAGVGGRIGGLGAELAGELEHDVIFGVEGLVGVLIDIRLVVPHPHQLLKSIAGGVAVSGDVVVIGEGDVLADGVLLRLGALVRPDDGRAQGIARLIHAQAAHHLSGEGHRGDVVLVDAGLGDQSLRGVADGFPPVVGVLLRPVVVEVVAAIAVHRGTDQPALLGKQSRLVSGGAQIVCDYIFHGRLSFEIGVKGDSPPPSRQARSRMRFSVAMVPMFSVAPRVEAAQWEPSTTLSSSNQAGSSGGSWAKASMPAP